MQRILSFSIGKGMLRKVSNCSCLVKRLEDIITT